MNYDDELEPEDSRGISPITGVEKKKARGKPFIAGHSGNPRGRPKGSGTSKDLRLMAREYTELALDTLVEICGNPDEKGAARATAAGMILDRGWGKAPQTVVIDGEVDVAGLDNTRLDEITRRELAAFLGKGLAGASEAEDSGKLN